MSKIRPAIAALSYLIGIGAAVMLAGCAKPAQQETLPQSDSLADQLAARIDAAATAGASGVLRVAVDGSVIIETGFGSASCTDDEPVTPDHYFMIGSITKEFTQLLGFVLEEKGVLSLDDTVSQRLSGFDGPASNVTLRQLLDHSAGLPDTIDELGQAIAYTVDYDYMPVSRDELIARAARAQLLYEPGTEKRYSNLGYQLAAAIYEVTTDESYPALLRRYIYEPAGMTHTDFWFGDAESPRFADGCRSGGAHWGNPIDDGMWGLAGPSWNLLGAGGLLSTAGSLARFFEGIGNDVYFETAAQAERFRASRMNYSERRGQKVIGSAGSNGIFNAVALWRDGDRVSIVLMTNRADHRAENGLIRDIANLVP